MTNYIQYILFIVQLISLGYIANAQQDCDEITSKYSGTCIQEGYEKEIVLYNNGQRIGTLEKYYHNGQLKEKYSKNLLTSSSLDGELIGINYSKTGGIKEEIKIINGTGTIKLYYEDTIELIAYFQNGRPSGTWVYFFPFGSEEKRIYFDSLTVNRLQNFDDLYKAFKNYEDLLKGIDKESSSFSGLFHEFYSPGKLYREISYAEGKIIDTIKTYSIRGYLQEEASVGSKMHNNLTGFANWYDSTGIVYSHFELDNGSGVYWEYHAEEKVSYWGYYKNGVADETWIVKDSIGGSTIREIKSSELNPVQCATMSCIMEDFATKRIKMRKIYNPYYANPWEIPPPKQD